MTTFLAIVIGLAFGAALNRAGATNPENITNMLRLTDTHLMKVILFAVGLSSLLVFAGMYLGIVDPGHLSVKTAYWGVLIGGMILGVGFGIIGYCPGTGLAAAATGRIDGLVFVIGGLVGAFAYTLSHAAVKASGILDKVFGGASTLAETGNSKFPVILDMYPGQLVAGAIAIALMLIAILLPRVLRSEEQTSAAAGGFSVSKT